MSHTKLKTRRQSRSSLVEARQVRRFLPALLGLEDRLLMATFTVTNTLDNTSTGSLRWAVGQANTTAGNNTVNFDSTVFATPKTIALSAGVLYLSDTTGTETIIGPAAGVTVNAGKTSGVFNAQAGVTASISGMTITGGSVTGNGGGVYNAATLDLIDCTISGSASAGVGGGLFNSGYGTATLTNCTISGNSEASRYGGAGVYNNGVISLAGCTISGNSANYNGGGLYINYGTATLTDCTISGNTSAGLGGGLEFFYANVTMTNCTVTSNTSLYGGGLYSVFFSSATLTNTIIAGNTATIDPNIIGTVSGTNNLIGAGGTGGLSNGVNGNIVGVANAAVGTLGFYGGPTETVPLLPGSPAIDAGTSNGAPATDQRGLGRYGPVDIGAFESQGFTFTVVPGGTPQSAQIGTAFANPLALTVVANNPIEPVDGGIVNFVAMPASNGASAIFSSNPVIITGGKASVMAAPNNIDGSYVVVGSSAQFTASFDLTNTGTPLPGLVVNTTSDSANPGAGLLSLREAINDENTLAFPMPPLPITFSPTVFATPQTIDISNGELYLTNTAVPITITGPAAGVTLNAGGSSVIFDVEAGVTASISGMTITGGDSTYYTGKGEGGGGLFNDGTLTLTDCIISGNTAADDGGGLFNSYAGVATLTDCTLSGNYSGGRFGGGAIYDEGLITLTGCTLSGNTTAFNGAGMYIFDGKATLTDCTISGNNANFFGGGLELFAGSATLTNCTVTDNSAGTYYGGGMTVFYNSTVTATNTIIAGNTAPSGADIGGTGPVTGSNNLIGTGGSGGLVNGVNGNLVGVVNLALGTLGFYGGPTETIPLLPGCPAIDAGTSNGAPTTDQRGLGRVGPVDIGAFESQGFTFTVVPGGTPQSAQIGTEFANPLAVTVVANNPIEPVDGGIVNFTPIPASNGASAIFSSNPAVIVDGEASIFAAPNNVDGSYVVIGSSTDFTTSYDLTNTGTPFAALVVNTTSDSPDPGAGLLSLREAIAEDNSPVFPLFPLPITFDPTVFATPQTIEMSYGQFELSDTTFPITITGPAAGVTIDAGEASRVLLVDPGVTATISGLTFTGGVGMTYGGGIYNDGGNLTLTDCTISGNSVVPASGGYNLYAIGGGVFNSTTGTLTMTGCSISGNSAYYLYAGYYGSYKLGYGGGLLNEGTATLTNCTVTGNTSGNTGGGVENIGTISLNGCYISYNASAYGAGFVNLHQSATLTDCTITYNFANEAGGVLNGSYGTISLTGCTISGNSGGVRAGGLYNGFGSTAVLTDCTVSGNTSAGVGGGVVVNGTVDMVGSTISGNYADTKGGGVYVQDGSVNLTNCTISGNSASNGGGIDFYYSASSTLINCTVSGNTATSGNGGGINNYYSQVSLTNTIVAGNNGENGAGDIYLTYGAGYLQPGTISGSNNLIGIGGSGGLVDGVNGNLVGVANVYLSPLGNYGGPTETMALLPGSVALGAGVTVSGVTTDQRGVAIDSTPDIGAFFSEGFLYTVVPTSTPQVAATGTAFDQPLAVLVTAVNPMDPVAGGVVTFSVGSAMNGATATLSGTIVTIGSDGTAEVIATANNILGSYTATATIPGDAADPPATFNLMNVLPLHFSGIDASQTVASGSLVTFVGVLSNGVGASPVGETVAITLEGVTQYAVIGSTGAFSTTFDTTGLLTSTSPFTVTYVYTTDGIAFGDASTTSQVTITPVIIFGPIPNQVYGVPPLTLSATASSGLTVTYVVLSGPAKVSGDILSITGVGTVVIEAEAGNSTFGFAPSVDESFMVTPATLTIDPTANQSKVYGASVPTLTETATGFVNGNNSLLLTGSLSTTATTASGVGTYAFTLGTLSAGPNYTLVLETPSPTFAVTPATLTINPTASQSKVYGAAVPGLTETVSGFVNGDTSSLVSGSIGTIATTSSGVGSYPFIAGTLTAGPNYIFVVAASPTFVVTPATLTIFGTAGQSKVYGAAVPPVTGTVTGFVNGDSPSLLSGTPGTIATAKSGVGNYAFTTGTLSAGPNYIFVGSASPTFAVTPALLTVHPTAGQSGVYGSTVSTLTETVTGYVNNDTSSLLSGSLGTTATATSGVGSYNFTIGTLTSGPNYTLVVANPSPTFTITAATLTIVPNPGQSKFYGAPIPVLTYTTSGLVAGDQPSIVTGMLGTTAQVNSTIPYYYSFTLGTLSAGANYKLVLSATSPSFVVNRVPLIITVKANQSKVYGADDPALNFTVTGFVNGDSPSLLTGVALPLATKSSPVGYYPVTLGTLFAGPAYIVTLAASTPEFAVTPAPLVVYPTAGQSKIDGAPVPPLTDTVAGLVNGDLSSIITGSIGTTATTTSPQGLYPFTLGTLSAGPNYTLSIANPSPEFAVTGTAIDPVAVNHSYNTNRDATLITTTGNGVLVGDTDPSNLPLTALLVTTTGHGLLKLSANGSFIYTPVSGFSGTDSFTYAVSDGKYSSAVATVTLVVKPAEVLNDYFGAGQSDPAVYLVNYGAFAILNTQTGATEIVPFGISGAGQTIPAPGDYFANGQTDIAAYLPSIGAFAIRNPAGGPDDIIPFGISGAGMTIPAPGDYFGTGATDIAAYLPSIGAFALRNPAGGPDAIIPFGMTGLGNSIPAPGDYDGSGKTELAVYLPSIGAFAYRPANGGPDVIVPFGIAGTGNSIPAPGDYDGSGKTEFAVYLPSLGEFAYRPANGGPDVIEQFGIPGSGQTLPAPGDYTDVGHDELAVFLPATATFAIRPGGGQSDILGLFGAAGLGNSIPVTVVDEALATMPSTVSTLSINIPDPSEITDSVIFPSDTDTETPKKKKHKSG